MPRTNGSPASAELLTSETDSTAFLPIEEVRSILYSGPASPAMNPPDANFSGGDVASDDDSALSTADS